MMQYYPSSNDCIQKTNLLFCSWGIQKGSFNKGSSTPLWTNPSKTFYKLLLIFNIVIFSIFTIFTIIQYKEYIRTFTDIEAQYVNEYMRYIYCGSIINTEINKDCSTINYKYPAGHNVTTIGNLANEYCLNKINDNSDNFDFPYLWYILIGILIFFLNFVIIYFLYTIDYASDLEWSRYIIFSIIGCLLLLTFNFIQYFKFINHMNVLYDNKDNTFNDITKDCKLKYQINMYFEGIISGLISLYNILHIFKITHNIKVLFLSDNDEIIAVISEDNITTIN